MKSISLDVPPPCGTPPAVFAGVEWEVSFHLLVVNASSRTLIRTVLPRTSQNFSKWSLWIHLVSCLIEIWKKARPILGTQWL